MAAKLALFLALSLLFAAAAHGCAPYCPGGPVVPAPPPPAYRGHGHGHCSIDALKLSVCANVLHLIKIGLPVPEYNDCCPLLEGLVDLDAAVCLCTAINANVLGIDLNLPIDLSLILNKCGKICPHDFTCPHY